MKNNYNVYDKKDFFENYYKLRESKINANELIEKPVLFSLLPNLKEKIVLDLGCGFGEHCLQYSRLGANRVVGIDISNKMLDIARKVNASINIEYINMAMEDIEKIDMKFDIVCSSLAFQYVRDFKSLIEKIYQVLNNGGYLIFSQEHPLTSSYSEEKGPRWEKNENGEKIACRLIDYCIEVERKSIWYDTLVTKYHRTFSTIINTLIEVGFTISKVIEPILDEEKMELYPEYKDNYHRPDFILVKAVKK